MSASNSSQVVLHHLENSRSQRVLWLLEELGIDYSLEVYKRDPKTNLAPDALKAIHPLGRSPVLSTSDGVLAESGAIIEYLIKHYGSDKFGAPELPTDYQNYLFWMHFAEGSLMPPLVAKLVLGKAKEKAGPFFIRPLVKKIVDGIMDAYYGPNLQQSIRYIESYLSHHDWFAGESLTGADFQMIFPLEALLSRASGNFPAIEAYVRKVHQREAYQRALEKGGDYAYA